MHRRLPRRRVLGALGASLGLASVRGAAAAEMYTLRMSLPTPAGAALTLAYLQLASAVQRRSNGQLIIEVYPTLQLAKEQASIDGLTTGVVDLTNQATGFLVPLIPQFQVFDLPFLFRDPAAGFRVLDGPIGDEFYARLDSKGIVGMGWGASFKELSTTTKPIVTPEDMKGLRIRIQNSALYVATYEALGAIPVPLDVSEAYLALTQHTVDAIDINLDALTTGKYYNVVKHVAMSNHFLSVNVTMGSKRKIESLPVALQKILKEEAKAVGPFWRTLTARTIADDVQVLKKSGVVFSEIQYAPFRKAMDPVYASFQAKLGGDLIERIGRAAGGS
jgi:TRAP-type transport system periplasmic protein